MESQATYQYPAIFRNGNRRPTTRRRRKKASPFKVIMRDWFKDGGGEVCDGFCSDDHTVDPLPCLYSLSHGLLLATCLP